MRIALKAHTGEDHHRNLEGAPNPEGAPNLDRALTTSLTSYRGANKVVSTSHQSQSSIL